MKKKYWIIYLILVFLVILDTSFFQYFRILEVKPNLSLVYVCLMGYFMDSHDSIFVGLTAGLLIDLLVGRVIGFYGLTYMLAAFIIGILPKKIFWNNFIVAFIMSMSVIISVEFLSYIISEIGTFLSGGIDSLTLEPVQIMTRKILPEALYNIIVFIPLFFIANAISKYINKDKGLMGNGSN